MTVTGLDDYRATADDPNDGVEHVHTILRDRVNFVLNQSPVVQFVVHDVEHWRGGVLPVEETDVRLDRSSAAVWSRRDRGGMSGNSIFNLRT